MDRSRASSPLRSPSRSRRRGASTITTVATSLGVFSCLVVMLFLVRFVGPLALFLVPVLAVVGVTTLRLLWVPAPDPAPTPSPSVQPVPSRPALCADAAAELARLEASERSLEGLLAAAEAFGAPSDLVAQSREVSATTSRSLRSRAEQVSAVSAAASSAGSVDARTNLSASYLTLLTSLHEGVDAHERLTAAAANLCSAATLETAGVDPSVQDATDVLVARARALRELGTSSPLPAPAAEPSRRPLPN